MAESCTPYEQEVAALVSEAKLFQQDQRFSEFGFSAKGGFRPWMERARSLADSSETAEFFGKFGYTPMMVKQIADEYRLKGALDAYWQAIEDQIDAAPSCD